jgi:hypothetical protein
MSAALPSFGHSDFGQACLGDARRNRFREEPIRVVVYSFKVDELPEVLRNHVYRNYAPFWANVWIYAPQVRPTDAEVRLLFTDSYVIETEEPDSVRIDGQDYASGTVARAAPACRPCCGSDHNPESRQPWEGLYSWERAFGRFYFPAASGRKGFEERTRSRGLISGWEGNSSDAAIAHTEIGALGMIGPQGVEGAVVPH